ncbi:MAG: DUF5723 family protein [Cytophagales bacterium]|nr:DUF5723 family protein [Cytophagales bacterium]
MSIRRDTWLRIFCLLCALLLERGDILAQTASNLLAGFLSQNPQSNLLHASAVPKEGWFFITIPTPLPPFLNGDLFYDNGIFISPLYREEEEQNILDVSALYDRLSGGSGLDFGVGALLLHAAYRWEEERMYFSFHVRDRLGFSFKYPENLLRVLWGGNRFLVEEPADFLDISPQILHYREVGFGASYEINYRWDVGVIVKYIQGFVHFETLPASSFLIGIDDNTFAHRFTTKDLGLHGTVPNISDPSYFFSNGNRGMALDLSGHYEVDEDLHVYLSARDIGFIRWKEGTYEVRVSDTEFVYNGVNFLDTSDLLSTLDSLQQSFEVDFRLGSEVSELLNLGLDEEDDNVEEFSYTAWIPQRFFLTTVYDITDIDHLSGSVMVHHSSANWRGIYSLGYYRDLPFGLGVSTSLLKYPHQILSMTGAMFYNRGYWSVYLSAGDLFTFWTPLSVRNIDLSAGASFILGRSLKRTRSKKRSRTNSKIPDMRKHRYRNMFGKPECPPGNPNYPSKN